MMSRERISRELPPIDRRRFLRATGLVVGIGMAGDIASGYTLGSPITHYDRVGSGHGTLSVAVPGFLAPNGEQQTAPLREAWNQYGDTLTIQATGGTYDEAKMAEYTAEQVAKRLQRREYGRVIMNGVSMGGNVTADALLMLQANGTFEDFSTVPSAVMLDTPASGNDIPGKFQAAAPFAEYPAGRLTNLLPKLNGMDESLAISQAEALTDRAPLEEDSLNFLSRLVYWESLQGTDMILPGRATANWRRTVGIDKFEHVEVDMKHVDFEANRDLSYAAMLGIYADLTVS
jgi:pimeloyl-ACP methyl ester carboxylesterase